MIPYIMEYAIPFFFLLAVVYGALGISGVFKNRAVNLIIALAIAFFGMTYQPFITWLYVVMPYAIALFIAVFFIGFVVKLFKGKKGGKKDYTLILIVIGLFLILFVRFGEDIEDWTATLGMPITYESLVGIVCIVVLIAFFYGAYKLSRQGG